MQFNYTNSNPPSTHSSPQSYALELDAGPPPGPHSHSYPIPSYTPQIHSSHRGGVLLQPSRSASYSSTTSNSSHGHLHHPPPISLQVSTSTSSMHDHEERTARPGNAHVHAQFHSGLLGLSGPSTTSTNGGAHGMDGFGLGIGLGGMGMEGETPTAGTGPSAAFGLGGGMGGRGLLVEDMEDDPDPRGLHHPHHSHAAHDRTDDHGDHPPASSAPHLSTPGLLNGLSRQLTDLERDRLAHLDRLKYFLATAPSRWDSSAANATGGAGGSEYEDGVNVGGGGIGSTLGLDAAAAVAAYHHAPPHPALNRFLLPNGEFVTCVLWNGLYHITGTDIVRALVFRFEAFGRPVRNMKKFEEGVFSDLRNLKPGVDACLEEPKSPFLDLLFKYQCIRTQKKQKVFYWFSVPHDRLFLDALERDLKREKMSMEPTTQITGEPAMSFTYDSKRTLYEQFSRASEPERGRSRGGNGRGGDRVGGNSSSSASLSNDESDNDSIMTDESDATGSEAEYQTDEDYVPGSGGVRRTARRDRKKVGPNNAHLLYIAGGLFEGSPTYKQRKKKNARGTGSISGGSGLRRGSMAEDMYEGDHSRETSLTRGGGDDYSRSDSVGGGGLSAADLFLKQARGELVPADGVVRKPKMTDPLGGTGSGDVGVYYSRGHHPEEYHPHERQGSFDSSSSDAFGSSPSSTNGHHPSHSNGGISLPPGQKLITPSPNATGLAQYEAISADGKVRAFVCPLFSCGRLFKRMEHLKRHLRTHTMERPYSCTMCTKRFSRSDNLTQHLRTHDRPGGGSHSRSNSVSDGIGMGFGGMGMGVGLGGSMGLGGGAGVEDWDTSDVGSASDVGSVGGSPRFSTTSLYPSHHGGYGHGGHHEDEEFARLSVGLSHLEMFGDPSGGLGPMGGVPSGMGVNGPMGGLGDLGVGVPGGFGAGVDEPMDLGVDWTSGAVASDSPSSGSAAPNSAASQAIQRSTSSTSASLPPNPTTNGDTSWGTRPSSRVYGDEFSIGLPASAPAHKQSFGMGGAGDMFSGDMGGMGGMMGMNGMNMGMGIPRHRSMTPSLRDDPNQQQGQQQQQQHPYPLPHPPSRSASRAGSIHSVHSVRSSHSVHASPAVRNVGLPSGLRGEEREPSPRVV